MRRLLKLAAITAALAGLVRWLKRRGKPDESAAGEPDRAEELRRKLAETRGTEAEADEPVAAPDATVEERRAEVHEQGRETLDEMSRPDGS